jgi:hypothetical protein
VAVNVIGLPATPEASTVAVSRCSPAVGPSVHCGAVATPLASVTIVPVGIEPPPLRDLEADLHARDRVVAGVAHDDGRAHGSAVPTAAVCALPPDRRRVAGAPAVTLAVMVSGVSVPTWAFSVWTPSVLPRRHGWSPRPSRS